MGRFREKRKGFGKWMELGEDWPAGGIEVGSPQVVWPGARELRRRL